MSLMVLGHICAVKSYSVVVENTGSQQDAPLVYLHCQAESIVLVDQELTGASGGIDQALELFNSGSATDLQLRFTMVRFNQSYNALPILV
jgi:hypothetical protein